MIGFTLARYFCTRFALAIGAVLVMISGMMYVVDFVELLRRAGHVAGVSSATVAYLSLLRIPVISEEILPFCVLFGTMAAFLLLSRKLELLVARAVGVSVWGLLVPPLAIAVTAGITSVTLLNPLFLIMKHRADAIEAQLFGRNPQNPETAAWIRQSSIDGEAFLKAGTVSNDGRVLSGATAYVYDRAGSFEHRIEAPGAKLFPGLWEFLQARLTAPGEEASGPMTYLLATELSPDEVLKGTIDADSVPIWDLQEARATAERAGLNGDRYALRLQTLLARPLLFAAMVLIAAAFSLRFFRFGGIERMVFGGAGAGFMLYAAAKFVSDLGGAGLLNPVLAAWSPAAVASLLGFVALVSQEDG